MGFLDRMLRFSLGSAYRLGLGCCLLSGFLWADGEEGGSNVQAILQQLQMQQAVSELPPLRFQRYNERLFTTAYQAYLYNGEPAKAFQVAQAAVGFHPDNIVWRERLAQSATWSSHAQVALEQYLYFFEHHRQKKENLERILTLATQLQNYDLQLFALLEKRKIEPQNRKKIGLDIVKVMQGQGRPLAAIRFIQKEVGYESDKNWQKALYNLAVGTLNEALMLQTLKRLQALEPQDAYYPINIASIFWNRGEPQKAFIWLDNYFKRHRHSHLSKLFLSNYIFAAASTNQSWVVMHALAFAVAEGNATLSQYRELVYFETAFGYEAQAFQHALLGYQRSRDTMLLGNVLSLGSVVHQEKTVLALIDGLTVEEKEKLMRGFERPINLANLYTNVHQFDDASKIWQKLIQRYPNKQPVQVGYLWFLLASEQYPALKQALSALAKPALLLITGQDAPWHPLAMAYITLMQYDRALAIFQLHQNELHDDVAGLVDIADLWQELGQPIRAYWFRKIALAVLVHQHPKPIPSQLSEQLLTNLTQLLRAFGGVEATWLALQEIYRRSTQGTMSPEQIVAFALEKNDYSLARLLVQSMRRAEQPIPNWMVLNLALAEWDKDVLAKTQQKPRLPERDRTNAALKIEDFRHAEEFAYEGLQLRPFDNENYTLFKQVTLPRANRLRADNYYFAFNSLVGFYNKLDARLRWSPAWMMMPFNHIWFIDNQDKTVIQDAPSIMRNTGAIVRQWIHRGWLDYKLEERQGLEQFASAALDWRYLLKERLSAQTKLALYEEANETATLLVGGMKNTLETLWVYNHSDFDLFDVFLGAWRYFGQNRQALGNGLGATWHWQHHFRLDEPDWNANVYLETRRFYNNNIFLRSPLQRLLPPDTPPGEGTDFYMPVGYNQVAFLFGYGQKYRDDYCQQWRSFFDLGATYSDAFGIGKLFSLGYGGMLFGRDKLLFYIDYSDNTQQGAQKVYSAGLRYDHYF